MTISTISVQEYNTLKQQGYNRIPLCRHVLADLDTPVRTYLKLANKPYSYLFESVQGGEKWGRYSFIGLPCKTLFTIHGDQLSISESGEVIESFQHSQPLDFVEEFKARYKVYEPEELPEFSGGLVGYFAYDTVRYAESRLKKGMPEDDLGNPDVLLMVSDELLVFDNLSGKITIIVHANTELDDGYQQALQRLAELESELSQPLQRDEAMIAPFIDDAADAEDLLSEADFVSSYGEEVFKQSVDRIKDYILAGDTMQTVLSQRLSTYFDAEPLNLYRALRTLNPSPYMYYLNLENTYVVGSSPEILARLQDNQVTVRPIAGTRKRGATKAEDLALEKDLLADPKEIAEHLMLIDLGRNDAGRVSQIGSVELTEKMCVERYSHVMHIVSNVTGQLLPGKTAMDVLKATLPAGTLSGAPKIRAMEIIDELEPVKRGIYGGAVGYLGWYGNMDTAIAIRTAVIKDKQLYAQAGAGVVADSQPQSEWDETMNKARALMRAAAMVQLKTKYHPTHRDKTS